MKQAKLHAHAKPRKGALRPRSRMEQQLVDCGPPRFRSLEAALQVRFCRRDEHEQAVAKQTPDAGFQHSRGRRPIAVRHLLRCGLHLSIVAMPGIGC